VTNINLTDRQRDALLRLGNTDTEFETLTTEVLGELLTLGVLYRRADGNLDLSVAGQRLYQQLKSRP
jgi:hypothetical protein